MSEIKSVG